MSDRGGYPGWARSSPIYFTSEDDALDYSRQWTGPDHDIVVEEIVQRVVGEKPVTDSWLADLDARKAEEKRLRDIQELDDEAARLREKASKLRGVGG